LSLSGLLILTVQMPSEVDVVTSDIIRAEIIRNLNVLYLPRTLPHWANADAAATQVRRSW